MIDSPGRFKVFESVAPDLSAVIRPEAVMVRKKTETLEYPASADEGEVVDVSFRGNSLELKIKVNDCVLTAHRQLGQELIEIGEKVFVFVRCMYVLDGDKAYLVENDIFTNPNSVII